MNEYKINLSYTVEFYKFNVILTIIINVKANISWHIEALIRYAPFAMAFERDKTPFCKVTHLEIWLLFNNGYCESWMSSRKIQERFITEICPSEISRTTIIAY